MAKNYHKYTEYERYVDFKRLDFIVKCLQSYFNRSNVKGLDLGCGEGNITVPLAFLGYRMTGIDISPQRIKKARSKQSTMDNPKFFVGDAENLKVRKKFDFVICSEVLEHLNTPQKALKSIKEILNKSGLLIVTIPNGYGPYSLIFDHFRNIIRRIIPKVGASDHVQAFKLSEICNLLNEVGFEILKVKHSDFIAFLPPLQNINVICRWDCKVADKLPSALVSG